jgi:hypothetical protein
MHSGHLHTSPIAAHHHSFTEPLNKPLGEQVFDQKRQASNESKQGNLAVPAPKNQGEDDPHQPNQVKGRLHQDLPQQRRKDMFHYFIPF